MPTEAEWEYCTRGGEEQTYSGSDNIDEVAWYGEDWEVSTHPVGEKKGNGFGLYDMSGNVWEWVWDSWKQNTKKMKQPTQLLTRHAQSCLPWWLLVQRCEVHECLPTLRGRCVSPALRPGFSFSAKLSLRMAFVGSSKSMFDLSCRRLALGIITRYKWSCDVPFFVVFALCIVSQYLVFRGQASCCIGVSRGGDIRRDSSQSSPDQSRMAVVSRLSRTEFSVMTRENMMTILRDNNSMVDCFEGMCEVDIGRIGADIIITEIFSR